MWRAERAGETLGARSAPFGRAEVEVLDADGAVAARAVTSEANHIWVNGLRPATTYRYRVRVNNEPWAEGQRFDWAPGNLVPAWRAPDQRLRTHPTADDPDPVTFLAIGDFGVGIASGVDGHRQLAVARTMQRLADAVDIRFIVGLGDSIYHGPAGPTDHSGAFDEDWWLTFFQPYRYLFDHLAFYPTAGNHDGSDEESSDDRRQLEDNLFLQTRFRTAGRDRPGLDRPGAVLPAASRRAVGAGVRRHHVGRRAGHALVQRSAAARMAAAGLRRRGRHLASAVLSPPRLLRGPTPWRNGRADRIAVPALPPQRRPADAAWPRAQLPAWARQRAALRRLRSRGQARSNAPRPGSTRPQRCPGPRNRIACWFR